MGLPDRLTEGHSAPFVTVSGSILSHKYTVNLKQLFFIIVNMIIFGFILWNFSHFYIFAETGWPTEGSMV